MCLNKKKIQSRFESINERTAKYVHENFDAQKRKKSKRDFASLAMRENAWRNVVEKTNSYILCNTKENQQNTCVVVVT